MQPGAEQWTAEGSTRMELKMDVGWGGVSCSVYKCVRVYRCVKCASVCVSLCLHVYACEVTEVDVGLCMFMCPYFHECT